MVTGRKAEAKRNSAYFTILPKAGPADWPPPERKNKITKKESLLPGKFALTRKKRGPRGHGDTCLDTSPAWES